MLSSNRESNQGVRKEGPPATPTVPFGSKWERFGSSSLLVLLMSKFVRTSKYRHVFAQTPKRDGVYEGVKLTKQAWDSNFIIANPKWIAVAWQVAGGGATGSSPPSPPFRFSPLIS